MPFQLVVVQGGRSTTPAVKLGAGATTVGRQEDCQFRIASSMVSRKHCQIVEHQGKLYVKDLGSSNGTVVNGKKVVDQQVLSPGDRLTIWAGSPSAWRPRPKAGRRPSPAVRAGDTAVPVAAAVEVDDAPIVDPPRPSRTRTVIDQPTASQGPRARMQRRASLRRVFPKAWPYGASSAPRRFPSRRPGR